MHMGLLTFDEGLSDYLPFARSGDNQPPAVRQNRQSNTPILFPPRAIGTLVGERTMIET